MQLVAYGAQDIYLTGNPQITFFKVVYRRHTNFSMESIQQTLNGTVANSGRSTCTISRNGDLVHKMYLQGTRAATEIANGVVKSITSVELEIGGQRIDKHLGQWMEAWAELTENKTGRGLATNFQNMSGYGSAKALNETVSGLASGTAADARFFNAVDQESLPFFAPLQFWFCRNPGLALPLIALQYHEVKVIFNWSSDLTTNITTDVSLWADYIYLDTDERRRFAQVSHEYLIEQVQHQSRTGATKETLNFNHPVKELVLTGAWSGVLGNALANGRTMTLKLNGHERFSPRNSTYFSRAQVYQHHSGEGGFVDGSILVYSFALKPEEHQPSGTCNFSRIDNAELVFSGAGSEDGHTFAVNYNVLRIMSGMGGLAYSN